MMRDAKLQRLDSEIRFFKLNEIDANYKDNHTRIPDLSADIRIVFRTEEYIGKYVGHGKSKTAFVIRSSRCRNIVPQRVNISTLRKSYTN